MAMCYLSAWIGHVRCEAGGQEIFEFYAWGRATNHQLGFGVPSGEQLLPRLVQLPRKLEVRSVACGRFHSVAVAACGSVLSWGFGGSSGSRIAPLQRCSWRELVTPVYTNLCTLPGGACNLFLLNYLLLSSIPLPSLLKKWVWCHQLSVQTHPTRSIIVYS